VSLPESSFDEPRGVLVRKPQTTIYTVLLGIVAAALAVSCLLLLLEWSRYEFQFRPPPEMRGAVGTAAPILPA